MVNIVNNDFNIQDFRNLENVNQDNVNNLSSDKDMRLAAYMDNYNTSNTTRASTSVQVGSICSGVGSIATMGYLPARFGQSGNTLTFTLYPGAIRFLDQAVTYASALYSQNQSVVARFQGTADSAGAGNSITQTFSLVSGTPLTDTDYYIVAVLDTTAIDAYNNTLTCTIPATNLITLTDLQSNQSGANPTYVALFKVNTSDGTNYTVSVDEYCANNYNCLTQTQVSSLMPNGVVVSQNQTGVSIGYTTNTNCTVSTATMSWRKYSNSNTLLNLYFSGTVNYFYVNEPQTDVFIIEVEGGQININLQELLTGHTLSNYTNKSYTYNMNIPGDKNIAAVGVISLNNYNPNNSSQVRDCPSRNLSDTLPLYKICDTDYTDIQINFNFLTGYNYDVGAQQTLSYELNIYFELTDNL
jgi:hypothetical protein